MIGELDASRSLVNSWREKKTVQPRGSHDVMVCEF